MKRRPDPPQGLTDVQQTEVKAKFRALLLTDKGVLFEGAPAPPPRSPPPHGGRALAIIIRRSAGGGVRLVPYLFNSMMARPSPHRANLCKCGIYLPCQDKGRS